jgi:hypothetical protein
MHETTSIVDEEKHRSEGTHTKSNEIRRGKASTRPLTMLDEQMMFSASNIYFSKIQLARHHWTVERSMSVTGFDSKYLHAHPVETQDLAMPTRTYVVLMWLAQSSTLDIKIWRSIYNWARHNRCKSHKPFFKNFPRSL